MGPTAMGEFICCTSQARSPSSSLAKIVRKIWPATAIVLGFTLAIIRMCFLGYELIKENLRRAGWSSAANQFIHLSEGGDHEGGRDHYWGHEATGRHDWKRTRIVSIEIETDDGPLVFQITPFAAYDLRAYLAQPSRLVVEWPDAREL